MNEKPRSLLLGFLAMFWAGAGMNYPVYSLGWSTSAAYALWVPILVVLVAALFSVYRRESHAGGYKRAPVAKGLIGLIIGCLAVVVCKKGIDLVLDGYYLAISWLVFSAILAVVAVGAVRASVRDIRLSPR